MTEWICCPVCGGKTRCKARPDTVLMNFPLYCSKCKRETVIDPKENRITTSVEPDAQTQSR